MSNNRLVFSGLDELRAVLRRLPEECAVEAGKIIEGEANAAAAEMRQKYPVRTGNLMQGVVVTRVDRGKYAAGAIVKNRARHAHLWEFGSQVRFTKRGANRGAMPEPPNPVFVPAMVRARTRMYQALRDLLTRKGLSVTGEP